MLYYDFSYLENLCFLAGEKQPRLYRKMKESVEREYRPLVGSDIDTQDLWSVSATGLYSLVYYSQHLYNPRLLVVMQPFFGADMYLRRHILSLINKIRSRGTAVLLLAINISDSPVVADRMLVLQNGCITREYGQQEMERLNRMKEL
jgi:ribose transport system ATP-binding protein